MGMKMKITSLKGRLALSMFSVVAIAGVFSGAIGGYLLHRHLLEEARNRVRQDLNAARAFYQQRLKSMEAALRYTALGERFSRAVAARDLVYLSSRLAAVRKCEGLDILCVTDADGRVTHRTHHQEVSGDVLTEDPLVRSILDGGEAVRATMLIPVTELQHGSPSLGERARIRIVPTPRARPLADTELAHGMMLCAAAPVRTADGKLAGVLRAGILLNRNYDLVDQVQNTVFHDERYRGRLLGTATIFQQGVRISTNVLREDGSRAIGSCVSAEVYNHVLEQGRTWVGRAWVVNDWYISAYAPIRSADGDAVGMLYVGVLAQKFRDVTLRTLSIFALMIVGGLLAAAIVSWRLAAGVSRPVSELASAASVIAGGDFSRTLPVESTEEINALTRAFNTMAESLKERDELLKEQTRLQLTRSERLAAIGRLAAGVAHEINNPLTGVLTFAHMLLKSAPENSQEKEDLETIIEATTRCRDIVRSLLNFSRQNAPRKKRSDVNDLVRQALTLTRNQARIAGVNFVEKLESDLPSLVIDPNQIQEVVVNVIVNATDAMPDGGDLTVHTGTVEEEDVTWVVLEISDTGHGISAEDLERIFDPFFTTKQADKGTGLGLAVSYGIVAEHNGHITVSSEVNRGTTVTIRLPATLKDSEDEHETTDTGGG